MILHHINNITETLRKIFTFTYYIQHHCICISCTSINMRMWQIWTMRHFSAISWRWAVKNLKEAVYGNVTDAVSIVPSFFPFSHTCRYGFIIGWPVSRYFYSAQLCIAYSYHRPAFYMSDPKRFSIIKHNNS